MSTLPAPVSVSPLIKFGRYTALFTGILYGAYRFRKHKREEIAFREFEAKQKVIRDAKLAVEKKRLTKEELLYLAKESGITVPADFDQRF